MHSVESDGCSLSPDGIPSFLGGTGTEWLHCCVAHDMSQLQLADHYELARCISETGHPLIAFVFFSAVVLFSRVYVLSKRKIKES